MTLDGPAQATKSLDPSFDKASPSGDSGTPTQYAIEAFAVSKAATWLAVAQAMNKTFPSELAVMAAGEASPGHQGAPSGRWLARSSGKSESASLWALAADEAIKPETKAISPKNCLFEIDVMPQGLFGLT